MWYVYIVRSVDFPDQEYTGATENLKTRSQRWQVSSPRQIQALEADLVLRLPRQTEGTGIRKIPQIPFRPRVRKEAPFNNRLTNRAAPLLPHGRVQLIPQRHQALAQTRQFHDRTSRRRQDRRGHRPCLFPQRLALGGERDQDLALVLARTGPPDQMGGLQPLPKGRQR